MSANRFRQAYGQTPGSIMSKKSSMTVASEAEGRKIAAKAKISKRRAAFDAAVAPMLAHLDVASDTPSGKLWKNLNDAKRAKDKLGAQPRGL